MMIFEIAADYNSSLKSYFDNSDLPKDEIADCKSLVMDYFIMRTALVSFRLYFQPGIGYLAYIQLPT